MGVLRVSYSNLVTLHINTKFISNRASFNFVSTSVFSFLSVYFPLFLTDIFSYGGQQASSSRERNRR